jgi:hypothetical protein
MLPFNILMVHSPKLTIIADSKHQTGSSFTLGKTARFGSMSLFDEGNVSVAVFVGMAHNGSLSLHTIVEDSTDEGDRASSRGRCSAFPISQECNMVTPSVPITTTPLSEGTPMPLAIAIAPLWTAAP